jgi:hypothetical protein
MLPIDPAFLLRQPLFIIDEISESFLRSRYLIIETKVTRTAKSPNTRPMMASLDQLGTLANSTPIGLPLCGRTTGLEPDMTADADDYYLKAKSGGRSSLLVERPSLTTEH